MVMNSLEGHSINANNLGKFSHKGSLDYFYLPFFIICAMNMSQLPIF